MFDFVEEISTKIKILVFLSLLFISYTIYEKKQEEKLFERRRIVNNELVIETFTPDDEIIKTDINSATIKEFLDKKVTLNLAHRIVEYRDVVGGVANMDELLKVKGVGESTLGKLKKNFEVRSKNRSRKKIKINRASKRDLIFFNFSKEEVSKILKWRSEKGEIYSNIDLKKILGEQRYEEVRDDIDYLK